MVKDGSDLGDEGYVVPAPPFSRFRHVPYGQSTLKDDISIECGPLIRWLS